MKDKQDDVSTSRRRFIRNAGAAAVVASPLGAIANTVVNGVTYADGEGVTFADGPRPIVNNFPGKKDMILVHSRPPHLSSSESKEPISSSGSAWRFSAISRCTAMMSTPYLSEAWISAWLHDFGSVCPSP